MYQLSLTDFVDIVSRSGIQKANKVKQLKHRPEYDPSTDFYKRIRDDIITLHKKNKNLDFLDKTLTNLTDPKKVTAYPFIIKGYKKWSGKKSFNWFEPPSTIYSSSSIDINVNPELGLEIDGNPYLIKLYFKANSLEKQQIDIILNLMKKTLSTEYLLPKNTIMAVLDIRRSKLITPTISIPNLDIILKAELAYIGNLWASI
jgi:hypothetical protein